MNTAEPLLQRYERLKDLFGDLGSSRARYQHLVEMSRDLPPMDAEMRLDANLVPGCVAKVWLASFVRDDCLFLYGDSEAVMPKGLLALVVELFSGARLDEVAAFDRDIVAELGLAQSLTPTRALAAGNMVRRVRVMAQCGNGKVE
jgi:cysteine desulfuration protein SufE